MKFELNRLQRGSSLEQIKQEIIRVAGLIPDTIIIKQKFDELSKIASSTLVRKFGTWENVLKECGLEHRYSGQLVSEKMKNQIARGISDSELIDELKRVANILKTEELSQINFNSNSQYSASVICRRFGNWSKGLEIAGLKAMWQKYSELDYFENLLNVWTHYGRQPIYREMNSPPSKITSGAYEKKWGKWTSALLAFIDYANGDKLIPEEETFQSVSSSINEIKKTAQERRDIPIGLRYKVLSRDRFRCVKCGKSPAFNLDCELHIDHIIPFSKGGPTNLENLQTTCKLCNLGKGNRYNE